MALNLEPQALGEVLPESERRHDLRFAITEPLQRHQKLFEQLRESEERFRIMADCAPVLLWMAEPDGLCSFFNKTWLDFTGRPLEEELGNGWAEGVHPEDFQPCMHIYLNAFVLRRPFRMEYRLRRADGQYRWILDQGVPRYTPRGGFAGYIGSCIDITEMKDAHLALEQMNEALESRVHDRTAELQRSNDELQQFAYAASHDLQAPLRAIVGYTELIRQRYAGRLDADADDFIGFIVEGGKRMQSMISDLLAYSRAGTSPVCFEPIDCNAALDHALENLAASIEESGAVIQRGNLPPVPMDMTQMTLLLQNLVGNAVKFRGERPPVVEIGAEAHGSEWRFHVRDNGIGIAPEHIGRIFQVFQRLHTAEQYPGTGIGLAICKRTVERYGGRIWVESAPGQGSTFFFTLPSVQSAPAAPQEHGHAAA
jgi:PAS domain S-box-containing protein